MTRDIMAYGMTTTEYTPGASAFVYITDDKYVVGRYLFAGQTLCYYAGIPTPSLLAATLAAKLVHLPNIGLYIPGPAPIAILGSNPIYVTTYLSQGYNVTSMGY